MLWKECYPLHLSLHRILHLDLPLKIKWEVRIFTQHPTTTTTQNKCVLLWLEIGFGSNSSRWNFRKTTSCISSDIRKPFDCQWPILTSCRTTTLNLFPTISKHIPIKKAWKCIDVVMVRCSWIPDHFTARICGENGVWIGSFRVVLSLLCFLPSRTYIFLGAFTWGPRHNSFWLRLHM